MSGILHSVENWENVDRFNQYKVKSDMRRYETYHILYELSHVMISSAEACMLTFITGCQQGNQRLFVGVALIYADVALSTTFKMRYINKCNYVNTYIRSIYTDNVMNIDRISSYIKNGRENNFLEWFAP